MHSQLILCAFKNLMYSSKTETDLHISLELYISLFLCETVIYIALLLPVRQKMKTACIPLKPPQLPKDYAVSKLGNTQTKYSPP